MENVLIQPSPRELEVLYWLAQGLSETQVAEELFIAPNTVRSHKRRLRIKLLVQKEICMVYICCKRGWL